MKKIVLLMFAGMLAMSVEAGNVVFKVTNMHCGNCAKRVEKTLKANEAVSDVEVNLEKKAVKVTFDETKTNAEALQLALTEAKFQAEVAKGCGGCKHHKEAAEGEGEKHECKGHGEKH
jgi:copper chaperone CopZ